MKIVNNIQFTQFCIINIDNIPGIPLGVTAGPAPTDYHFHFVYIHY